jgi:dUTP pyrophosphatase
MKVVLDKGAILPTRAHDLDAGYDLYSREDAVVYAGDSWTFDTGVHLAIPEGWVGDVKSKSGIMMKYGIITDGTVDAGYTGSIRVKLFNLSRCAVSIVKGQKIAQLVIKRIATPELEVVDRLEDTDRGTGGFGSTGDF